jgi:hypothetical protein
MLSRLLAIGGMVAGAVAGAIDVYFVTICLQYAFTAEDEGEIRGRDREKTEGRKRERETGQSRGEVSRKDGIAEGRWDEGRRGREGARLSALVAWSRARLQVQAICTYYLILLKRMGAERDWELGYFWNFLFLTRGVWRPIAKVRQGWGSYRGIGESSEPFVHSFRLLWGQIIAPRRSVKIMGSYRVEIEIDLLGPT